MTQLNQKKPKLSLKDRIKSFFKIPEEDLQEEKDAKVFEKVPLVTLTRNKIFLAIVAFLIIVNVLVGFDINFLYIRAILSFIFLITIPGLLIMLCFKIRTVKFWEFLVYTVGLSVAFIMFAGLAVNWTLPALNITDKPLSLFPILICFNLFLVALGIVAWKRNKDFQPFQFTVPKLNALNNIFFIIPMAFPVLAILGAFLLNNHGSNILTMIMFGSIAVYVLLLTIFRKKINENVWPWALYWIGLALLLVYSMRSWYVVGWDINQEVKVAKLVLLNNHWTMNLFQDAYNACLSLSILSPILKLFLNIKIDLVFKLIIQILFSTLPIIIYSMYKKVINKKILIFLACFFFISQIYFISQMPALIRQEIAYLFFALFFLLLFSKDIKYKNIILLIFGISIIVSHYSTSYIFLFSLLGIYLITTMIRKIPKYKKKITLVFSLTLLLILFIFGFLWASQITQTSSGLTSTVYDTITKVGQIFNIESRSEIIQSLAFKKIDYYSIYQNYSNEISNQYQNNPNLNILSGQNSITYAPPVIKGITDYNLFKIFNSIQFIISSYFKLLIFLGVFICIFFIKEFKRRDYFIYSILFLLITLLIAILPYISLSYNFERIYLQALIFLSLTTIYCGYKLFNLIIKKENISIILLSILLIFFLIFSSLLIPFLFVGGTGGSLIFQNHGEDFNKFYTLNSDINSLEWISFNAQNNGVFYFDRYAELKVFSILPNFSQTIFNDVNSKTIDKNSYVFSSYSNQIGYSTVSYGGVLFNINFPTEFLNDNKNKIYNNGGSEIFK